MEVSPSRHPIAELGLTLVTPAERDGYQRWGRRYARLWAGAFDPIGLRISMDGDELRMDLSVRPIALRTDYRDLMEVAGEAQLSADATDPHGYGLGPCGLGRGPRRPAPCARSKACWPWSPPAWSDRSVGVGRSRCHLARRGPRAL